LKYLDFLDDRKFAVWWVEQRLAFRPKSKLSLKFELKGKGIDENLIKEVLFETKVDEVKLAKDLIEKKRYKWEKLDNFEARRKMSEFLARKGFNWEIIRKILDINEE
jgi:regulatory protein